jgi:catechol 2,3-dioxygenase-like lactoylglutathione lyase family enzyme
MPFSSLQVPVSMPYKLTSSVCLFAPDLEKAVRHFEREMGLTVVNRTDDGADLSGGEIHLHIERGPELGPIMEILVPDIEMAKVDLVSQGWGVVVWEGKEGICRLRNPAGTLFHIIEEASAFDSEEFQQDIS